MSWLILVIVGVVLLCIGAWAPMPSPLPRICTIIGVILVVVGLALMLYVLLLAGHATTRDDLNGMRAVLQL